MIEENSLRLIHKETSGPLPTSTYDLFDGNNEVGMIQVRHQPSHSQEVPAEFASHIYYEISPEHRGKSYGKQILKLGLLEAKKLGIKDTLATCYEDNVHSRRIIENAGGILERSCLIGSRKFLKYKFV